MSRSEEIGGNSEPAARRSGSTAAASVRAAARNIWSVTVEAPDTIAPRPTPGKMNTLFAWPISTRRPSTETGSNGEPVATMARPPVQARQSAGVASAEEVGFDSGRIVGTSVGPRLSAIARTTASSKVPAIPVAPTRNVGRRSRMVSSSEPPPVGAATASSAFSSSRSERPSWTSPRLSTSAIASRMCGLSRPASTIARRSSRAIPIPAAPAPTSTIRASSRRRPVARSAARTAARTTAAVPWMSSLNDRTRVR